MSLGPVQARASVADAPAILPCPVESMPLGGGPPNDLCSSVTPVALSVGASLNFTGDNTTATFTGDAVPGSLLDQYPFPNTWHAFTTTTCANITVSYCATNSGWSNVWKLLTTQCPADSVINPNFAEQTTCDNGNWTFTFNQLAAGTYYLPVPNVGFGQGGGAYSIDVTAGPCSNDLCSEITPEPLPVGGSLNFIGDNTNASYPGDAVPGSILDQNPFANTWHAFTTVECSNITISYCGTNDGWSTVWKLLTTQCPADAVIYPNFADTTTCANGNWTFTFLELPPGTYYLPVPNVGFGQGGGPYNIDVTSAPCVNDFCTDAVPLPLELGSTLTFVGDNTGATFDGDAVPGSLLDQFPFANSWHAFITSHCTKITVSYCGTADGWSTVWKLLTTQCPADAVIYPLTEDTTTCANGNWTFSFDELQPGTYYLPVPNVGFGQGGGPYTVTVTADPCSNDLCGNVIPQSLAIGSTLTFTGDNTNATFAGDAVPGNVMDQPGQQFANTWHAFTTVGCADVTVDYCGTASGWSQVWKLLTTDCPADMMVYPESQDTTTCSNSNWTFFFNDLAPGTYYLPVPNVGFGQGGGPYSIDVSAVDCTIGIGEHNVTAPSWTVYPNPTTGIITVVSPKTTGPAILDLMDMTGRIVWSRSLQLNAGGSMQFTMTGEAAPGTYLLQMTTTTGRSAQRLMVR